MYVHKLKICKNDVLAAKRPKNAAHGAIRGEVKAATSPRGERHHFLGVLLFEDANRPAQKRVQTISII